ncbi:MAG: 3'-5' exonuclease [Bacteroidota bacterium]|nr:3'-5' exonuclease [Bacteroidota bacterium]
MYLFFDTETTGLPRNYKAPIEDSDNWPRLVQIAWLLYDNDGNRIDGKEFIIKPEGFTIPIEASRVHGISTEKAISEGQDLNEILILFAKDIEKANSIVAHNISFDEKIVGAEFYRKKVANKLFQKKRICTMKASTNFCRLPGRYGYKWPNLAELHTKLFGKSFEGAHDAAADINATAKCFWRLKELHVI